MNATPPLDGVFPGAMVTVSGANLSGGTLTLGDRAVKIVSANANQITFVVPSDLTPGPAILKFSNGVDTASVVIAIGAPPPDIRSVTGAGNVAVDMDHAARAGDTLNLLVSNLADAGTTPDFTRIHVTIGGVDLSVRAVTPLAQGHQVQVIVASSVPAGHLAIDRIDRWTQFPALLRCPVNP